jgi:hypothetical protein
MAEPVLEDENGLLIPHLWPNSETIYKAFDDVLEAREILDRKQPAKLSWVLTVVRL